VAPEDKFDRLQQLVEKGKEQGYVAYEDLSDALPTDLGNGTELGNLLAGLDGSGIELLEDPKLEFDQNCWIWIWVRLPAKRSTIRYVRICARWVLSRCFRAKASGKLRGASSAASIS
jgi:hypothetical protein